MRLTVLEMEKMQKIMLSHVPLSSWVEHGVCAVQIRVLILLTHWKRPACLERLKAGAKGTAEHEVGGWHHWCDGQGSLVCCTLWDSKESDMTE